MDSYDRQNHGRISTDPIQSTTGLRGEEKDAKKREPTELASEVTGSNKEQLRGQGTMQLKEIPKETKRHRQIGWEAVAAATV